MAMHCGNCRQPEAECRCGDRFGLRFDTVEAATMPELIFRGTFADRQRLVARNDPLAEQAKTRARIVREALRSLANDPSAGWLFNAVAQQASDEALEHLGRLLK